MSSTWKLSILSLATALLMSSSVFGETNQVVVQPKSPANSLPEPIVAGQAVPGAAQNNPQRPVLGVRVKPTAEGVSVVGVTFGSAADRAGFHLGDEIRYVSDQRVRTAQDLANEIQKLNPGSSVDMFVVRDGEPLVKTVNFPGNPATSGQTTATPPQQAGTQEQIRALNQQINQMNQQLYYQNQEINRMRSFRMIRIPPTDPADYAWWLRVQRGETNNDPAIFQ